MYGKKPMMKPKDMPKGMPPKGMGKKHDAPKKKK